LANSGILLRISTSLVKLMGRPPGSFFIQPLSRYRSALSLQFYVNCFTLLFSFWHQPSVLVSLRLDLPGILPSHSGGYVPAFRAAVAGMALEGSVTSVSRSIPASGSRTAGFGSQTGTFTAPAIPIARSQIRTLSAATHGDLSWAGRSARTLRSVVDARSIADQMWPYAARGFRPSFGPYRSWASARRKQTEIPHLGADPEYRPNRMSWAVTARRIGRKWPWIF
jgi:hypothetical protein